MVKIITGRLQPSTGDRVRRQKGRTASTAIRRGNKMGEVIRRHKARFYPGSFLGDFSPNFGSSPQKVFARSL